MYNKIKKNKTIKINRKSINIPTYPSLRLSYARSHSHAGRVQSTAQLASGYKTHTHAQQVAHHYVTNINEHLRRSPKR